jgi:hypothetical protein
LNAEQELSVDVLESATPETAREFMTFYPHMWTRISGLGVQGRLVHYSSAEAAMNILEHKEIWLRNTTVMNDFMEVEHGLQALSDAFRSASGQRFQEFLNHHFDGVCEEVANIFDGWQPALRDETYIACVSEHQASEDTLGRLSMWRAYGGSAGVAIVLKSAPFRSQTDILKAYSTPVRYSSRSGLEADFLQLTAGLDANLDLLQALGRERVQGHLFNMFKWSALSIKHPGFEEEREWRVTYTPKMGASEVLQPAVRAVRGLPQIVYRLPLRTFEGTSFSTAVPDIVDRIIIGPTEYPLALRAAFVELLNDAGLPDAAARVFVSDIPLR